MGGSEKVPADNNADLCVGFCSSLAVSNASLLARKEVQGASTLEGESQLPAGKRDASLVVVQMGSRRRPCSYPAWIVA